MVNKLRSNNFFGSKNTLGKAFLPVTSHAVAHTRTNGREREIGIWVWQKRWHRWWCDAIMLVWRSSPNRFLPGQLISGMLLQVSSSANLCTFGTMDGFQFSMATAWWPNSSSRWWLRVAYLFGCDCSSFVDVDFLSWVTAVGVKCIFCVFWVIAPQSCRMDLRNPFSLVLSNCVPTQFLLWSSLLITC